jgi:hypothetical protein
MSERLVANLVVFARTLRACGVGVREGGVADGVLALMHVGVERKRDVKDALRATFVFRHEDLARFDDLFDRFWRARARGGNLAGPRPMQVPERSRTALRLLAPAGAGPASDTPGDEGGTPLGRATYSADEVMRRKDFAALTPDEIAQAEAAISRLSWDPGLRRTRRWKSGEGRLVDLRRLLRANAKHGGEPVVLPRRRRTFAPRPLVILADVSGSMEPYARMLLLFAHALAGRARRVEVFVFATRLTRVTRQLMKGHARTALPRARDAARDWAGGTRIGEAVHAFNAHWARRTMRGRPVILLISDGWDLGDPALLAREMARLQRSAFRLIWLNPLLGSPDYAPLTRGLQAALPFVDDFLSIRSLSSLEALAAHLSTLGPGHAAPPYVESGLSRTGYAWT